MKRKMYMSQAETKTNENSLKKGFIKILLFVIFAIPGALAAVFSGIVMVAQFFDSHEKFPGSPVVLFLIFLTGIFATLLGLGKIKQWLYGLVFVSIPFFFWLYLLLNPKMFGGTILAMLVIGGMSFFVFYKIKDFYEKRPEKSSSW